MSLQELLKDKLQEEKHLIAQALVSHSKNVKIVLLKKNKLAGEKRTAEFEILVGDRTTTIHKENDCLFNVDIARTYFSGKLYFERSRIAGEVKDGEDILVLFCGVGPFLIWTGSFSKPSPHPAETRRHSPFLYLQEGL
ncbi:MAG: hypothetical protein ABIH80_01315 [Methanobacteriota archaeon]